jgi:hypothetical protein
MSLSTATAMDSPQLTSQIDPTISSYINMYETNALTLTLADLNVKPIVPTNNTTNSIENSVNSGLRNTNNVNSIYVQRSEDNGNGPDSMSNKQTNSSDSILSNGNSINISEPINLEGQKKNQNSLLSISTSMTPAEFISPATASSPISSTSG